MLGVVRHQLAPELERVLAGCLRQLIHEAFEIDGVLIVVHPAPEPRRDVGVAHRMVDQQVRDLVAEHAFRPGRIETLEHERIHAVLQQLRQQAGDDGLPGQAHMQRGEIALRVEPAGQLALRDRMVAAMRHILFARPDQLDRRPRHLLGDQHRLLDEVMRRGAAAKATAQVHSVHVAFADRKPGRGGSDREGGLGVLGRRPDLAPVRGP